MNPTTIATLAGLLSVFTTGGVTVWSRRRAGPMAHAQIVTASTLLLAQLQTRVAALEARVATLETENLEHEANLVRYEALYGPLPSDNEGEAQ